MDTLLIVDGNGLMHRAYHALPPFKTASGIPTHVVYGFFSILQKALTDFQPTHLLVCFDTPAATFRNRLHKEYQSQRPKIADDFIVQIPMVKTSLDAAHITHIELDGYEGDDIIGTVTKKAENKNFTVLILTGDKDMMQLVSKRVSTVTPDIGFSKTKVYTPSEVIKKMGVTPDHIVDLKSLTGDPSDNYKGANGIGPKTAQKLLLEFDTIENIIQNIDSMPNGKIKENLKASIDDIQVAKKLATIETNAPIQFEIDTMKWTGFSDGLREQLIAYEMYSLVPRLFPKLKKEKVVKKKQEDKSKDQISLF